MHALSICPKSGKLKGSFKFDCCACCDLINKPQSALRVECSALSICPKSGRLRGSFKFDCCACCDLINPPQSSLRVECTPYRSVLKRESLKEALSLTVAPAAI